MKRERCIEFEEAQEINNCGLLQSHLETRSESPLGAILGKSTLISRIIARGELICFDIDSDIDVASLMTKHFEFELLDRCESC